MTKKYCLIDGAVVEEPDLLRWRRWMEAARQRGALQIGHTVIRSWATVNRLTGRFCGLKYR
jgi:hypothetical protein